MVSLGRHRCQKLLALAGSLNIVACLPSPGCGSTAFAVPTGLGDGRIGGLHNHQLRAATLAVKRDVSPSMGVTHGIGAGWATVAAFVTCALLRGAARSKVVRHGRGQPLQKYYTHERKWWFISEDRDPTTLPIWQRDFAFGFNILKKKMVTEHKKGRKVFWRCRVLGNDPRGGYKIEMMISGLLGWCPPHPGVELKFGDIVKMECTACPLKRVIQESDNKPWPQMQFPRAPVPVFSHWTWLSHQSNRKKAKELEAGTIIDGWVWKHVRGKGLLMQLEGDYEPTPKGMLYMMDISRRMSNHDWVDKMFPLGTRMRLYVVHADPRNGRITLSCKEFEDDEHIGWMLSFPERMFAQAEEGVKRYHEKREAYIAYEQR